MNLTLHLCDENITNSRTSSAHTILRLLFSNVGNGNGMDGIGGIGGTLDSVVGFDVNVCEVRGLLAE